MARKVKLPAFQFYYGDWMRDAAVSSCSAATRGCWFDWICAMHDQDRCGQVIGTIEQLARVARATVIEATAAIEELQRTGAADVKVTLCNKTQTSIYEICNRRMRREYLARKSNYERQKRHRSKACNATCNADVAETSHPPSSTSFSITTSQGNSTLNTQVAEWREVETELLDLKMVKAPEAVAAARAAGCSIEQARAVVGFWRSQQPQLGVGALFDRLKILRPNQDPVELWPGQAPASLPKRRKLSWDEFKRLRGEFAQKPTRHATNKYWWWGTLRSGEVVECREVPPRCDQSIKEIT